MKLIEVMIKSAMSEHEVFLNDKESTKALMKYFLSFHLLKMSQREFDNTSHTRLDLFYETVGAVISDRTAW